MQDLNTTAGAVGQPPAHYSGAGGIDNFDVWDAYQMDPYSGNAFKYLARWDKKGSPLNDLKKARHYVQETLSRVWARGHHKAALNIPDGLRPTQVMDAFGLTGEVGGAVVSLLIYRQLIIDPEQYLYQAIEQIDRALAELGNGAGS